MCSSSITFHFLIIIPKLMQQDTENTKRSHVKYSFLFGRTFSDKWVENGNFMASCYSCVCRFDSLTDSLDITEISKLKGDAEHHAFFPYFGIAFWGVNKMAALALPRNLLLFIYLYFYFITFYQSNVVSVHSWVSSKQELLKAYWVNLALLLFWITATSIFKYI